MDGQIDDDYFQEIFSIFDQDDNGMICVTEFEQVLQAFGFNPTVEEVQRCLNNIDTDKSGKLDKEELKQWVISCRQILKNDEEELQKAFKKFDHNNDGYIHRDELRSILKKLGQVISEEELCEMIENVDVDRDGRININEFAQFLSKPLR